MTWRLLLCTILVTALVPVGMAEAARAPSRSEAKAIKKGFLKVRVSTVSRRYASVAYTSNVKTSSLFKAPSPVLLKKSGKKWKTVAPSKVPSKVKKDLKKKGAASNVTATGEVTAHFTRAANCSAGGVTIYDPAHDVLLSIQQAVSKGSGLHPALAVDTVVALYRNKGTELAYESGQPTDANAESGFFYRDPGAWGFVDADLAAPPVPDAKPLAVSVKGIWDCG